LRDGIKLDKTKQILQLLTNYFKQYHEDYVISEDTFNKIKEDIKGYL